MVPNVTGVEEQTVRSQIQAMIGAALLVLGLAGAAGADPYSSGMAAAGAHDYATAVQLWRPLADEGQANAQDSLGILYENGMGVVQDHAAAAALFHKAADQGLADAQFNLAICYLYGHGLTQSDTLAAYWFRKAADQGVASAFYALGDLYLNGHTIQKDPVQAYLWLSVAALRLPPTDGLHAPSIHSRDIAVRAMTAAQLDQAEKMLPQWPPR